MANDREKITAARIVRSSSPLVGPIPVVWVTLECGEEVRLFHYYPDEILFTTEEFIGRTVGEARALKQQKTIQYLQSEMPAQPSEVLPKRLRSGADYRQAIRVLRKRPLEEVREFLRDWGIGH